MPSLPRTVKIMLVESLRDKILLGELVPGQHLRLEEIANSYEVSTMPVREALNDLEAEGLVTIFPHRRTIVTELSAQDLEDIYDIRVTLEAMAARLAVPRVTPEILDQLGQYIEEMDAHFTEMAVLIKLNHDFHLTLYKASGRRHLVELTQMLRYRTRHYLHAYIADLGGMLLAQNEHREIVAACESGDADRAAEIISHHVIHVGRELINFVRKQEAAKKVNQ